jgi:hypothetical protein
MRPSLNQLHPAESRSPINESEFENVRKAILHRASLLRSDDNSLLTTYHPNVSQFFFYTAGFTFGAPNRFSQWGRWLYKNRVFNKLAVLVAITSICINALDSSLWLGANIAAFINYSFVPLCWCSLEHIMPVWRSLYDVGSPTIFIELRSRISTEIFITFTVMSAILSVIYIAWIYYLYTICYATFPYATTAAKFLAADSFIYGIHLTYLVSGVGGTVLLQRIISILHEVQLERLLRAIRDRKRDPLLCSAPPTAYPSIFERVKGIFSDPEKSLLSSIDPGVVVDRNRSGLTKHVPVSSIISMYLAVQRSIHYMSNMMLPMVVVNTYTLLAYYIYLFVLTFSPYDYYLGISYMVFFAFAILPLLMQPTAAVNYRFSKVSTLLDQSLSLYTSEEGMQISALLASRPLSASFLGVHVTFGSMAIVMHVMAVPAIIATARVLSVGSRVV